MTRINQAKYAELKRLADSTKDETISGLIRDIIHNRPIQVYSHDETMDLLMEELSHLRGEIKAIGVNINQITRFFNTYPEPRRKEFYAKIAFGEYLAIEPRIARLLEIISKLAKQWLSE
jgi:MobC-like protein